MRSNSFFAFMLGHTYEMEGALRRTDTSVRATARSTIAAVVATLGLLAAPWIASCNSALPPQLQTYRAAIPVTQPSAPGCSTSPTELLVIRDPTAPRSQTYALAEQHARGNRLSATFEIPRRERREVEFEVGDESAQVQVTFDTDYGRYPGRIDADASSIHLHADALCFDLAVTCMDGIPNAQEHWRGQVARR